MASKPDLNLRGARLEPPSNPGTWIGRLWRAKICTILTCLLNPRFIVPVVANTDGIPQNQEALITMGPNGWTAKFPTLNGPGAGGTGSASVPFSGSGAPSAATLPVGNYIAGPSPAVASLYVDITGKTLYVCTVSGTATTSVWSKISSSTAGGTMTKYNISAVNGDYLTVTTDGGLSFINIAKPEELRMSLASEVIDGVTITYVWTNSNIRVATDNATPPNSETQYCTPRYVVGGAIYAMTVTPSTGVGAVDLQSTKWIEVLPSRQWGGLN